MKQVFHTIKTFWKLTILILLVVIAFSYAMFQGGFVSWFLFYSFLPFALYGLALSLYQPRKVEVERFFSKKECKAGDELKVSIHLQRFSSFPLFYMVIEDQLNDSLASAKKESQEKTLVFPFFRRVVDFEYKIDELPRGEHLFRNIKIKIGDPLGLFEKTIIFPTKVDRIIVYPAYEVLRYSVLNMRHEQGMAASNEKIQRDTSMVVGIREYQPGDRFSWINWKASAKRNDMMTKEFEQRQSQNVTIIMDCSPDTRFEGIVSLTASLVMSILRTGSQVGLLTVSKDRINFPSRKGETHQHQLFHHLAKVQGCCDIPFDQVLERQAILRDANGTNLIVTAKISKELVEKIGSFVKKKQSAVIFLLKDTKEIPSVEELSLKAVLNARGIRVLIVNQGHFSDAFMGVDRS